MFTWQNLQTIFHIYHHHNINSSCLQSKVFSSTHNTNNLTSTGVWLFLTVHILEYQASESELQTINENTFYSSTINISAEFSAKRNSCKDDRYDRDYFLCVCYLRTGTLCLLPFFPDVHPKSRKKRMYPNGAST